MKPRDARCRDFGANQGTLRLTEASDLPPLPYLSWLDWLTLRLQPQSILQDWLSHRLTEREKYGTCIRDMHGRDRDGTIAWVVRIQRTAAQHVPSSPFHFTYVNLRRCPSSLCRMHYAKHIGQLIWSQLGYSGQRTICGVTAHWNVGIGPLSE